MIPGPLLLLILLWIFTVLYPGLFLATDTLWAFSHHMILLLKVLFLFFFLGRNTPGREPTLVPLSQLPSNYFSYPAFPAIPLKAFFCLISPDGPNLLILLLLGYICLSVIFNWTLNLYYLIGVNHHDNATLNNIVSGVLWLAITAIFISLPGSDIKWLILHD